VLLACTTFLFAGVYPFSLVIPALILLVLVAVYRPWRGAREAPPLHRWLLAITAAMLVQLIPLPAPIVDFLSPVDRVIRQGLNLTAVVGALPLSVHVPSSVRAIALYGGAMLVFVIARQVFGAGGVRIAVRGIATVGLVLAAISLAQDATAHGLMYWRWDPGEGPPPFGPFLNRNHFATWIVLAAPVCLGYLLAQASAHTRRERAPPSWHRRLIQVFDARSIWLSASICLMLVALVASMSRAGIVGLASALLVGAFLRSRRTGTAAAAWAVSAIGVALVGAAIRVNLSDVLQRFSSAGAAAVYRVDIWRAAMRVVKDFWLTGAGAGTFETVMLGYQRAPSLFRTNAAHNHYLQVAAEGGLLIGIPVAVALVLFVRESIRALARDDSGIYFLRAGALSGLSGVAVQSIWETGLTTPANAVLAAIVAAIAVHRTPSRSGN
jgi:putative inorganic carbon (HCO3(-)) transporter